MIDLIELEKLARDATPGPWSYDLYSGITAKSEYWGTATEIADKYIVKDGMFIAAANPDMIIKLINVVKAAKSLSGDLTAGDEKPDHYSSWFALQDALKSLEK